MVPLLPPQGVVAGFHKASLLAVWLCRRRCSCGEFGRQRIDSGWEEEKGGNLTMKMWQFIQVNTVLSSETKFPVPTDLTEVCLSLSDAHLHLMMR